MIGRGERKSGDNGSLDLVRAAEEVEAFERLLARTPWHRYRRLDRDLRDRTLTAPSTFAQWYRLEPGDVARLVAFTGRLVAAAGLLSMHPSGYIREVAVDALGRSGDAEALPFLLLRTTDWVEEVELAARSAVRSVIAVCGPLELVAATAQLEGLAKDGARGQAFTRELLAKTTTSLRFEALLDGLAATEPRIRRACATAIASRGRATDALEVAVAQGDMIAATTIAVAALDSAVDPAVVLGVLRGCRVPGLRALALYRMQETGDPRAVESSHVGLFDRSPSVRDHAQRYLRQQGIDVRQVYVEALPEVPAALLGLAEVGTVDDIALVAGFLEDGRSAARAYALHAMGRILGDASRRMALTMLADDAASVIRVAGRILERQSLDGAELDGLWELAISDRAPEPLRRAVFRVFAQQSRWPKLILAVRALTANEAEIRDRGALMLTSTMAAWNSTATDPTVVQLDELRQVAPKLGQRVPASQRAELDALLRRTVAKPPAGTHG